MNTKKTVRLFVLGLTLILTGFAGGQESSPNVPVGITRLVIAQRQIVFGGAAFGAAGQYELLTGTAYGELDPRAPGNAGIVNLNHAAVNPKGRVEYSTDVAILKPVDIAKENGRLVYDVVNRGRKVAPVQLNDGGIALGPNDAGTGFLIKRGYTVVWSGWQGDIAGGSDALRANLPVALQDGKPIVGASREEFTDVPAGPSFTSVLTYPAAALDSSAANLTVREHETDARQPLPASSWRFVDANHVQITAAPGFDRGAIYELIYPATNELVAGVGFAAMRDLMSFLRYADQDSTGQPNPTRARGAKFKATLGFGISQSGRALRDFVYLGFNADASGRIVFDGLLPIVAGARRTFTNFEFAQPGRFPRQHEDHLYPGDQFPFSYATTKDPISGKTDGVLALCTKSRTCPRIFHTDTDTEVWQSRISLLVTDTSGHPLALPDNVRAYMLSGLPHNRAADDHTRGSCQQFQNPLSCGAYARALLVALDQWVSEGAAPPPSVYPTLQNHMLVSLAQAQESYPTIPGAPFSPVMNLLQVVNPATMPPTASGKSYPVLVSALNKDGNPVGGVEVPEIAVPTATYSGRNIRAAGFGEGDLCGLSGSYIPFAATRAERMANGDSRPSLEERYSSPQDYADKRKRAVEALVQQRFVLPEDAAALEAKTLPTMVAAKP